MSTKANGHLAECTLSEEDLWSGLDRNAPEVVEHLEQCPTCQGRATGFRASIDAVAEVSTPAVTPLPSLVGPYVILRRLGEGGMGIVYEAEQPSPKRLVAIKVVRGGPTADEYRIRLFQREAQTLARLRHPAIAAVYEANRTQEGQHYFAMELVRGVPLTDYSRERQLSREDRLRLFCRICDAINYAHQRGVIHRDIKPTNILVDPEGNPKILDFGLARITDPDAGHSTIADAGRLMGTLPYMSPEEARGNTDEIDIRSDVYSLGVILYELMTDQLPHIVRRAALHEAVRIICEESPPRPSQYDRSLRGDLETILLRALDKEPARRYQSAAMLSEDITRFLSDQPILARRSSTLYSFRKLLVRHKLFFAFVLGSLVVVTGTRIWVIREAEQGFSSGVSVFDLQDLEVAVLEHKLAATKHGIGKLDEAEPHYRNALGTFKRLGRDPRTASTELALAELLLQREEPRERDYDEAESALWDALEIFDGDPSAWKEERLSALRHLQTLYTEIFVDPEALARVEARLEAIGREGTHPTEPTR